MTHTRYFLTGLSLFFGALVIAQQAPFNDEHHALVKELASSFTFEIEPTAVSEDEGWMQWATVSNYNFGKDRGDMTMIADMNALHPYFRDQINQLIKTCRKKGIELAVVESFRSSSKQDEYKAMGQKYTRSKGGRSKHQYGLAIDVVPVVNGQAQWHNKALWKKIGVVGEQLGLRWGGRWRHLYDPGHFEWTGGLTLAELANGIDPVIPNPEKYPCIAEDLARLKASWKAWEIEQAAIARNEPEGAKMK